MSALRPGSEKSVPLDRFIELHCLRGRDETSARIVYWDVTTRQPALVADDLPADGFVERWECRRTAGRRETPGKQVVWSSDELLVVVVHQDFRIAVEMWMSEGGYQDRLDELAGVPAPVDDEAPNSPQKRSTTLRSTESAEASA